MLVWTAAEGAVYEMLLPRVVLQWMLDERGNMDNGRASIFDDSSAAGGHLEKDYCAIPQPERGSR
jgi:hypothetical protein